MKKVFCLKNFRSFLRGDGGVAAIEAGFLFPMMLTVLCGMIDVGSALIANLKVTTACQIIGDLLAREGTTNDAQIEDAIVAGRLALSPMKTASYGVDVVGIRYLGSDLTPTVIWRETVNMEEGDGIVERSAGLGREDEGIVAVAVTYTFKPFFAGYVMGNVEMREEAFTRGRKGLFVEKL
ncbi:MAG: TadE/TadG family type IV pilus assembly protein [Alphaproteobacteria bacterium]